MASKANGVGGGGPQIVSPKIPKKGRAHMHVDDKDLKMVFDLQWKDRSVSKEHSIIVAMYDVPAITLQWDTFRSYLLTNSGFCGDSNDVIFIHSQPQDGGGIIVSETDFPIILYTFRQLARCNIVITLQLRHKNTSKCDTMLKKKAPADDIRGPEWFQSYMTKFKGELLSEIRSIVTTNLPQAPQVQCYTHQSVQVDPPCTVSGVGTASALPASIILPTCIKRRPSKGDTHKRRSKRSSESHNNEEIIKKNQHRLYRLDHKLDKLEHKTVKLKNKRLALRPSSDSDVACGPCVHTATIVAKGGQCVTSRNNHIREEEPPTDNSTPNPTPKKRVTILTAPPALVDNLVHVDDGEPKVLSKRYVCGLDMYPTEQWSKVQGRQPVHVETSARAGDIFMHTWLVQNDCSVAWNADTILKFTWGSQDLVPIQNTVKCPPLLPGERGTIAVHLRLPETLGTYECRWQFYQNGIRFGEWLGCVVNNKHPKLLHDHSNASSSSVAGPRSPSASPPTALPQPKYDVVRLGDQYEVLLAASMSDRFRPIAESHNVTVQSIVSSTTCTSPVVIPAPVVVEGGCDKLAQDDSGNSSSGSASGDSSANNSPHSSGRFEQQAAGGGVVLKTRSGFVGREPTEEDVAQISSSLGNLTLGGPMDVPPAITFHHSTTSHNAATTDTDIDVIDSDAGSIVSLQDSNSSYYYDEDIDTAFVGTVAPSMAPEMTSTAIAQSADGVSAVERLMPGGSGPGSENEFVVIPMPENGGRISLVEYHTAKSPTDSLTMTSSAMSVAITSSPRTSPQLVHGQMNYSSAVSSNSSNAALDSLRCDAVEARNVCRRLETLCSDVIQSRFAQQPQQQPQQQHQHQPQMQLLRNSVANRLFVFPQECPGFEVVYPQEKSNKVDETDAHCNTEPHDHHSVLPDDVAAPVTPDYSRSSSRVGTVSSTTMSDIITSTVTTTTTVEPTAPPQPTSDAAAPTVSSNPADSSSGTANSSTLGDIRKQMRHLFMRMADLKSGPSTAAPVPTVDGAELPPTLPEPASAAVGIDSQQREQPGGNVAAIKERAVNMEILVDMGFVDVDRNLALLTRHNDNIDAVVAELCGMPF